MSNFEVFDQPVETELKVECDYEGLRKVSMHELNGNATANNSIQIKISDCGVDHYSKKEIKSELVFSASLSNIKQSDVSFEWKNFDTITITYKKKLDVFKQVYVSKSVNPKIIFEYKTKE